MYNPREEARKKVWLVVAERGLQEEKESIYQIIVAQKKKFRQKYHRGIKHIIYEPKPQTRRASATPLKTIYNK